MKKIKYILFFLVLSNTLPAQDTINWDAVIDRYYEKYQPEVNPQWIFPIVFKNGIGKRDTIYLALDSNAHSFMPIPADTIYGEMYEAVDSFAFSAFWTDCPSTICDTLSVVKVNASVNGGGGAFRFYNGIKPLTVYFNSALFYSDSLGALLDSNGEQIYLPTPFEPLARGRVLINDFDSTLPVPPVTESCNWIHNDIWISDTIPPTFQVPCHFSDSLILQYDDDSPYAGEIFFNIRDWTGVWVSTEELEEKKSFQVYPNPSDGLILIESALDGSMPLELTLFDVGGRILLKKEMSMLFGSASLDLSTKENGLYYMQLKTKEHLSVHKISLLR